MQEANYIIQLLDIMINSKENQRADTFCDNQDKQGEP